MLQSLNDLFRTNQEDDSFLATQMSILQSDNLAWETVQQLGLAKSLGSAETSQPGGQVLGTPPAMKNAMVAAFKGQLHVERPKDTRMALVSFESADPNQAAVVVNSLVKNYIEDNFRTKYDATRQATGWMEQRLDELKLKVEKSEEAMVAYERQNNIANVGEKQTAAEARFEDMSKELSTAQTDRLSKESLYKMVASNDTQVGFIQTNSLLTSLEAKEIELKEQYSAALAQYGPTYPQALSLQDQIKDLGALVIRERKRVVENLHNDYLAAVQREKFLAAAVSQQKAEVDRVNQLLIEHNLLKRDFEGNQQLYDNLLQHLKDANVSAGLRATNIRIIDEASIPSFPVRPNRIRNIEFALVAGLILGIALAFTREALDNSIKNAQEIEKLTDLPTLSIVPLGHSSAVLRGPGLFHARREHSSNGDSGWPIEMAVLKKPGAAISEAYRTLRTSVLLSTAERPPQVLLITSSQLSEGKTATSLNLAATLAQKGSRVLLIDSDLRRPGLAKALKVPNGKGLAGILTGAYEYDDSLLQRIEDLGGLQLLPAGPYPPNPAELLCSMKMENLVVQLRQKFDHVILESPPVLPITDATILSSLVDGVIMVVECESTTRAALSRACRVMEHSGGKILGTVLNKVDTRRDGYYGYRYYHGYYSYKYKAYYNDKDRSAVS
ncbi:MAG TPA: polysaccharide biosynthesis tyrosine autokinase [Terriglobia bacterium]|nr:polysaccharide biosynthesis tyrosine autokinase [Terriglobia bacterium]